METKFQTSFIPKKPITPTVVVTRSPISIFFLVSMVLFLGSLLAAGGVLLWQNQLDAKHESLKEELAKQKKQFDSNFLTLLKEKTGKISIAKSLLDNHLAASKIFDMVGSITIENVRYKSFTLKYDPKANSAINISLTGEAKNYETVAYQSDVISENKYLRNAYLTNPSLQTNGYVSFSLAGTVDPTLLKYTDLFAPAPATTQSTESSNTLSGVEEGSAGNTPSPAINQGNPIENQNE